MVKRYTAEEVQWSEVQCRGGAMVGGAVVRMFNSEEVQGLLGATVSHI